MSQREKIVQTAVSQVGYREGGNNSNKYGEWFGLNNQSWCCIFVSWCAATAGISTSVIPKQASCTAMMNFFKRAGRFKPRGYTPSAGDLVLYDWDSSGDADHIGIVISTSGNSMTVVEGNTSAATNTSNGDGVYKRSRSLDAGYIRGFCLPDYGDSQNLYPMLKKGSSGDRVIYLQNRLNFCRERLNLGFGQLTADGIFGTNTDKAVRIFQTSRSLTADGIVGPNTWTALNWQYGDVNLDDTVNTDDALKVLQSTVGKITLSSDQKGVGDMNGDGKVDSSDALEILKRSVGK